MQCPTCGTEQIPGELFCDTCGADLRGLQGAATPQPAPQPPVMPVTVDATPQAAAAVSTVSPAPLVADPAALPSPIPPPATAPAAGPALVLKESGAIFPLAPGTEFTIGRTDPVDGIFPEIDLTPHDTLTGVSRRHAAIHEQGGQWFIRDLNSTNYTLVNRQRVQPGQDFLIEPGDEIRFGLLVAGFQA